MLDRLEKKFGKYAIKNLIYYILGAYVIGYVLYLINPQWHEYIVLYPSLVMKGQVWRLFTWVCTIPQSLGIFTIFMFLFYFFIGRSLESYMGAFRYNMYIFSGWFFTTVGVMLFYWITGAINGPGGAISVIASTNYMNLTSFLAFAVIFPDTRVLFFGIIPVKMKLLAWIDGIYLGLQVISGLIVALAPVDVVSQALQLYYEYPPSAIEVYLMRNSSTSLVVTILISFVNFFLFFFANAKRRAENKKRREDFYKKMRGQQAADNREKAAETPKYRADNSQTIVHKCSVCGRTNIDHPELMFRYCSKCNGDHEYCQDHLFTHEHVK